MCALAIVRLKQLLINLFVRRLDFSRDFKYIKELFINRNDSPGIEYIKALKNKKFIEADITELILKSSISILEAFNRVRNDQSFAHDNKVLNYNESLLIFGYVTTFIRFIEAIEMSTAEKAKAESIENEILPF